MSWPILGTVGIQWCSSFGMVHCTKSLLVMSVWVNRRWVTCLKTYCNGGVFEPILESYVTEWFFTMLMFIVKRRSEIRIVCNDVVRCFLLFSLFYPSAFSLLLYEIFIVLLNILFWHCSYSYCFIYLHTTTINVNLFQVKWLLFDYFPLFLCANYWVRNIRYSHVWMVFFW